MQGGAAITLLDSLDALLIFGQEEDFRSAVPLVEAVNFARNATVDVFEITIRCVPAPRTPAHDHRVMHMTHAYELLI